MKKFRVSICEHGLLYKTHLLVTFDADHHSLSETVSLGDNESFFSGDKQFFHQQTFFSNLAHTAQGSHPTYPFTL